MLKIEKNEALAIGHYHHTKMNIQRRIRNILKDGGLYTYINKKRSLTYRLNDKDRHFLKLISRNNILKNIITLKPERMRAFIWKSKKKFPNIYAQNNVIYKCIYNIFVDIGYKKLDKYQFIENIGLGSCPYCNRCYIYTLDRNRNIKPEIDHFYPKDFYPILAMSYYNLIPSCPTCNGFGAKSNQDTYKLKLKNPYLLKHNDFKFNFAVTSLNILNPLSNIDKDSVKIFFEKEIPNQSEVFGLSELYKEHRDVVIELYIKANHEYVKKYVDYLHSYKGLTFSDDEIYRLITCSYKDEKEHHKRPLSKLVRDISKELGITP